MDLDLKKWISSNCKFAQQQIMPPVVDAPGQQKLNFDKPPGTPEPTHQKSKLFPVKTQCPPEKYKLTWVSGHEDVSPIEEDRWSHSSSSHYTATTGHVKHGDSVYSLAGSIVSCDADNVQNIDDINAWTQAINANHKEDPLVHLEETEVYDREAEYADINFNIEQVKPLCSKEYYFNGRYVSTHYFFMIEKGTVSFEWEIRH